VSNVLETHAIDDLVAALVELPKPSKGLCFAFASCQYPAGLLDAVVARKSMELLEQRLEGAEGQRPKFLLQLGDQVYVDATAGLFDPTSVDDRYGRTYERRYAPEAVQSVLRRLPSHSMLDDHEIVDNWEPSTTDTRPDAQLNMGRRSYWRYQRFDHFDNAAREFEHDLSFEFHDSKTPFFVLDTRTRRSTRTAATVHEATLVDDASFGRLIEWLDKHHESVPNEPKFIACPALPLPRHLRSIGDAAAALRSDGWDGYPRSLHRLLGHIAINDIENVVFLSGDEHLSLVARATLKAEGKNKAVTVHSIHSSAMYAPFPFANGDPADFKSRDRFIFTADGLTCTCEVIETEFAPHADGFAVVSMAEGATEFVCEFVSAQRTYGVKIPLTLTAR
jgi:phosphodiesterase/alkaline phosphatase D-like protein